MQRLKLIKEEMKKVVVGHENLIEAMIIALISNEHLLIEGVPGIAKTTAVKTLSKICDLNFSRIQFTPDLLPSDILGVEIYNPKTNEFQIKKGPIFANMILADEINRAPSKVQSALLEAMQERQVSISDKTFKLQEPFMVMATQNPIEQEGTYPLPEAQLDRFMMKVIVGYNTLQEEIEIVKRLDKKEEVRQIIGKKDLEELRNIHKHIHIDEELIEYIAKIVYKTREKNEYIDFGASPRATIALYKASKAKAMLKNKNYVTPLDIIECAKDVLRHRIILNYKAEADGISVEKIIDSILEEVRIP